MGATQQIGRVSSASVQKATGKSWDEWLAILEKAGARSWTHKEIAEYLKKRHKLRPWWQQGVTLGFEIAIGRRLDGQNQKGEYMVTATKSLHVPAKAAWTLLLSEKGQKVWLKPLFQIAIQTGTQFETEDGFYGEIRTLKPGRGLRLTWCDPDWPKKTTLEIHLVDRPNERSIIVFNHTQIKDTRVQARLRERWRAAGDQFSELLPATARARSNDSRTRRVSKGA